MSRITGVECALVDLEPDTVRTDAVQAFVRQETILVTVTCDDGLDGTGYAYTVGTGDLVSNARQAKAVGLRGAKLKAGKPTAGACL